MARRSGLFITFEGGEGSGKSLQAERLARSLRAEGRAVTLTREPGGTPLGEDIRRALLHGAGAQPQPVAELLLFEAARAQIVAEVIRPALERGEFVISDRFADSSVAYQGYGRGLDPALVRSLNEAATGGLTPDLTLLLDLPVDTGLSRRAMAGDGNTFDGHPRAFHAAVREGYLEMAAAEADRWRIIDATQPADDVEERVRAAVRALLERTGA